MNKKYLPLIPAVSILVFISQVALAQDAVDAQDEIGKRESLEKITSKVDRWTEQAQRWAEKWKDKAKWGENLPFDADKVANIVKENRTKVCENTQKRVDERWSKYYDRRMNRVENMKKGALLLEKRIKFYEGKGLSATDLAPIKADLVTLNTKITAYEASFKDFLTALETAKKLPCGNREGDFLPALKSAKEKWAIVKTRADEVRDFYRLTVKKDLGELRAQLPIEKKINGTEEE